MAEKHPSSTVRAREGLTIPVSLEEADQSIKAIHSAESTRELADVLEQEAGGLLRCERATFYRVERHDKVANLVALREKGRSRISFPLGEGIAGGVARDNGYYLCNAPAHDELYLEAIDGIPNVTVRNVASAAMSVSEEPVGVLQAVNRRGRGFDEDDAYWLQQLADHGALAYVRLKRAEEGWSLVRNLAAAVANAVDDKHVSTVGHSDRTRQIALAVGKEMNLEEEELLELELAALLHDIGRLALSPEAFEGRDEKAPGYGWPDERLHVVLTEAILRGLRFPPYLAKVAEIALAHHERMDGQGFPKGKEGDELTLAARILAVANAFDMMASGRTAETRGQRLEDDDVAQLLKLRRKSDFDPAVVDKLVKGKLYRIEKRRFPRYDYETPLEYAVLGKGGQAPADRNIETKAVELSEGGILFRSEKKLPEQALLSMRIHLPTETVEALARVARNLPAPGGQGFNVGAYFLWYGARQ